MPEFTIDYTQTEISRQRIDVDDGRYGIDAPEEMINP